MSKLTTIIFFSLILIRNSHAQQPVVSKVKNVPYLNQLTAGPAIALGGFSETHYGGITVSYIRKLKQQATLESFHLQKSFWLAAASLSHHLGKKENTGLVSYRYKNYTVLELNGGFGWQADENLNLVIRTGPALGYYNRIFRFTYTGQLQGSYRTGPKTSITPGLAFIKEPGSDALWVTSLQLAFSF